MPEDIGKHKGRTIVLDFDGVINSYTSGWQGSATKIVDPPTPDARETIRLLRQNGWKVVVFSTRCMSPEGRDAILTYLEKWGIEVDDVAPKKPPALVYVDDRGYRFDGDWSKLISFVQDPEAVRPWNKKEVPQAIPGTLIDVLGITGNEPDADLPGLGQ